MKAIKFRKLVRGATDLETRMQKHCGEARGGDYIVVHSHILANDQRRQWWRENFWPRGKAITNSQQRAVCGQMGLFGHFFDEVKLPPTKRRRW